MGKDNLTDHEKALLVQVFKWKSIIVAAAFIGAGIGAAVTGDSMMMIWPVMILFLLMS